MGKSMSSKEKMASQQEMFLLQQEEQRERDGGGLRQMCQSWSQSQSYQQNEVSSQSQKVSQTKQVTMAASSQSSSQKTVITNGIDGDRTALDEAARRLSATVKTRQQLEAERDAMVKQTVERYKMEANLMSERHQMEEKQRLEAIEVERQRLEREELERRQNLIR